MQSASRLLSATTPRCWLIVVVVVLVIVLIVLVAFGDVLAGVLVGVACFDEISLEFPVLYVFSWEDVIAICFWMF